jgi:dTDP-4-dehydrorhamnose 3,5-epimerase
MITVTPAGLDGVLTIEPDVHRDGRGFLVETYRRDELAAAGIDVTFVQENHSRSSIGTLRGLHFQAPPGQVKLVRVLRGRILDVAIDIRASSPTFGQHMAVELDDESHRQLLIPEGFAHGFAVLSDVADVVYNLSTTYDPALERGVAWNDPSLNIAWPLAEPITSARDRSAPLLAELDPDLTTWPSARPDR